MMDLDSMFSQHTFDNFFYIFKHKYSISYNICIILVVFFVAYVFYWLSPLIAFPFIFSVIFILSWAYVH